MVKKTDPFPALCCGACYYCTKDETGYFCWAPLPVVNAEMQLSTRATPVLPEWMDCASFKQRMNA